MIFNPQDILETCPFCWKTPCQCLDSGQDAVMQTCKKCVEKDKEIEKLQKLLVLAGVGW